RCGFVSTSTRRTLSALFPYTTLFRSRLRDSDDLRAGGCEKRTPAGTPHERADAGPRECRDTTDSGNEEELLPQRAIDVGRDVMRDRKSTRLNSSHVSISYAVFCLKKK